MSDTKHSPGPWKVSISEEFPFDIVTRDAFGAVIGRDILAAVSTKQASLADAMSGKFMGAHATASAEANRRAVANAVLRAAAPEMLAALKSWQEVCERITDQYGGVVAGVDFSIMSAVTAAAIAEATKDIA